MHDLHAFVYVGEDGRLDEVANVSMALATDFDLGPLCLSVLNVLHNFVKLELGDLRTLEGLVLERVANNVLLYPLLKFLDKLQDMLADSSDANCRLYGQLTVS